MSPEARGRFKVIVMNAAMDAAKTADADVIFTKISDLAWSIRTDDRRMSEWLEAFGAGVLMTGPIRREGGAL